MKIACSLKGLHHHPFISLRFFAFIKFRRKLFKSHCFAEEKSNYHSVEKFRKIHKKNKRTGAVIMRML